MRMDDKDEDEDGKTRMTDESDDEDKNPWVYIMEGDTAMMDVRAAGKGEG